jgi:hypothetical protein
MDGILNNERFAQAFRQLSGVRLTPRRHTAANAMGHSGAVAAHAVGPGRANQCTEAELRRLEDLGLAHDIGKILRNALGDCDARK